MAVARRSLTVVSPNTAETPSSSTSSTKSAKSAADGSLSVLTPRMTPITLEPVQIGEVPEAVVGRQEQPALLWHYADLLLSP